MKIFLHCKILIEHDFYIQGLIIQWRNKQILMTVTQRTLENYLNYHRSIKKEPKNSRGSILPDMRIATPAFFWFPLAWKNFFHPLTFSLYVSLGLKWVSCRQHIYGSCFCIHSASLCLLVGAFNPYTFKVIIDMYVPITIFLIILGLLL